jgi:hypothetical protein
MRQDRSVLLVPPVHLVRSVLSVPTAPMVQRAPVSHLHQPVPRGLMDLIRHSNPRGRELLTDRSGLLAPLGRPTPSVPWGPKGQEVPTGHLGRLGLLVPLAPMVLGGPVRLVQMHLTDPKYLTGPMGHYARVLRLLKLLMDLRGP